MICKAQVLGIFTGTFKDEKGVEQIYNQLELLDQDAVRKEVLRVKIKPALVETAQPAIGKVAAVNLEYISGKLNFTGFAK